MVEEIPLLSDVAKKVRDASCDCWGPRRSVEIVGQSPDFVGTLEQAEKAARFREPVLITGESGVGKELMAQAIYLLSELCKQQPYVPVNCPQYREGNLTASELFGHKKGSFTGAIADRPGAFSKADGGVIFLDEIADLHHSAQAMLLRALATGEFSAVGSSESQSVDVRVVAATNKPLDELVARNEFRNDLYFRLRYFVLVIPPLRERGDDWYFLLHHFLQRLRDKYGVEKHFSKGSLRLLDGYAWPGNVRQLVSIATMGYAMADGDAIEPNHFATQLDTVPERAEEIGSLYSRITDGQSFWEVVYRQFMDRELNRAQVRAFVERGLLASKGSYRKLVEVVLGLPSSHYQKFMDFLRHHDLKP